MSIEQTADDQTSVTTASGDGRFVRTPIIEMEGGDVYHTPRELFVKRLINSPMQFGTQSISAEVGGGDSPEGIRQSRVHEIDVAVHPHRGAMVCGLVSGGADGDLERRLASVVERLEEGRRVLVEAADEYTWGGWSPPPVGLFVAAPDLDRDQMRKGWNEGKAWVCPDDDGRVVCAEMLEAMKATGAEAAIEDWQRMAAVVRSMGSYTSALEWLLEFEAV